MQALAKDMGVSAAGKAEDIMGRIAAAETDVPEENQLTEDEKAAAAAARQEDERAAELAAKGQEDEAQAATAAGEKAAAGQKATEDAEAAAGLVKVKAVTRFLDRQLNQIKDAGEAYSVSRERAAELAAAGVAEIVG